MRSGFTWLAALTAAAIAFGACDGRTTEVTTFRIGPDGKPVKGTERDEVVVDRQALNSIGWGYTWNCSGDQTLYGGELKAYFYAGASTADPNCRGWGLGGSNGMALSMPEWTWPTSGFVMDSSNGQMNPGSYVAKASDSNGGTHHGKWCWYRNTTFGNFSPTETPVGFPSLQQSACHDNVAPGGTFVGDLFVNPFSGGTPRSIDFARFCGPGGTPC